MSEFAESSPDSVGLYLDDIRTKADELLTAAEEVELGKVIEAGLYAKHLVETDQIGDYDPEDLEEVIREGEAASERFINANLRLAMNIAKRYNYRSSPGMSQADINQEGNAGLIRGLWGFDYKKGNKFSTYATWWINESIMRNLLNSDRSLRLPVHLREDMNLIVRAQRDFLKEFGHEPTDQELANLLDMKLSKIRQCISLMADATSLNTTVGDAEWGDFILDDHSFEDDVEMSFLAKRLELALESLNYREREVIMLYYGIGREEGLKLSEVGDRLGIGRERVRQIRNEAHIKIKSNFPDLKDFL